MKFKIGDTVRIVYGYLKRYDGKIGILESIDDDDEFPYNVLIGNDIIYVKIIEHII